MNRTVVQIADRGTGEPVSLGAALIADKKVAPDVTELLKQDHREAISFFDWYQQSADPATKKVVARKLCTALRAHMQVEEQIFYPATREATGDNALVDHAIEEHAEAKELVGRIEDSIEQDGAADDTVRELRSAIEEHVQEEETELFAEVRKSDMDLYSVGRRLAALKLEALFELTGRTSSDRPHPKETDKMPISQDEARSLFAAGLRDIHATVRQGQTMVERTLSRLENYPHVEQRLRAHLKDKEAQLARLEDIMGSLGESRSAFKDAAMASAGTLSTAMSAGAEDEILKNSLALYGLANFEAASYESLIVLGKAAGQTEALRKLQDSLSEERAIAAWMAENLRGVIMMHLQFRSEGQQAAR